MGLLSLRFFKAIFILAFLVLSACTSLFYHPQKHVMIFDPKKVGLEPQNIYFADETGRKLHGWYFSSRVEPSKGTIIFFHGNAENVTSHFMTLSWLPEAGYDYFIFDYSGYGLSEGEANQQSTVESGRAAIRWIQDNADSKKIVVYAHSLGGAIALRSLLDLRKELKISGIVIDGSFHSYQKIAQMRLASRWFLWPLQPLAYVLISDKYAPKKISELSPIPILVMHGQKDNVVDPEMGDLIFNLASEPKEIWKVPEGRHGNVFWVENMKYRNDFLHWIDRLQVQ